MPTDVIAELNRSLCATSDGARFATLVFVDIEPCSGQVTLINAGHPPALWVDAAGQLRPLESTGPALGLLPEARFAAHSFVLNEGDTLVAYSDGVTEAVDGEGEEYVVARVVEMISRPSSSAALLCQMVVDRVRQHASGPAADDISVLAVRRVAQAEAHE
jgi:sigma-B regulation protein RsbU (phosphoserine phosphatase)